MENPDSVIAMYRDGGTVHISEPSIELYIDRRIMTKTPGAVFHVYPEKGEPIKSESDLNAAKIVLGRAKVAHQNHRCTIADGLEWINHQLEDLKNV